jgi:CheY-like chemotaxis protein
VGVEPYKIAASLKGILAQRLMRKLCPACKEVWVESVPEELAKWVPRGTPLYRAVGCSDCAMTGYRGRFCIVEVLTVTPDVERAIGAGATSDRVAEAARAGGMRGLWESGLAHVLRGESSLDELMRVVDVPFENGTEPVLKTAEPEGRASGQVRASEALAQAAREVAEAAGHKAAVLGDGSFDLLDGLAAAPQKVARLRRKVLLVDDEDALRRVMKDLLEREGYVVAEARDGVQALDQVDRTGPDVIVLDLNLPGLDGYSVLSHLRSRPATADIPVVVLTAKGDEDNEVRVFELGADDFLTKPFRARALSARLDAVLGRRHPSA